MDKIAVRARIQHLSGYFTRQVDVLRLDELHPLTGGNKIFKLYHNIRAASQLEHKTLLTFGGAHSNHIAATAVACHGAGVRAIGIIRGDAGSDSSTLQLAREYGMQLVFEDRKNYRLKSEEAYLEDLRQKFGDLHLVPEGGANDLGLEGCREIMAGIGNYDYVLCACGSGTTYGGLLLAGGKKHIVVGISALKGPNTLPVFVSAMLNGKCSVQIGGDEVLSAKIINRHCILSSYAFSGFARYSSTLADFKTRFESATHIPLDYIYTTRLFYAVEDLCSKGMFPNGSRLLVIHSGGLQGNSDFEKRYQRKLTR